MHPQSENSSNKPSLVRLHRQACIGCSSNTAKQECKTVIRCTEEPISATVYLIEGSPTFFAPDTCIHPLVKMYRLLGVQKYITYEEVVNATHKKR